MKNFKVKLKLYLVSTVIRNVEIRISEEDFIGGIILKDFEGKFKIDNSHIF